MIENDAIEQTRRRIGNRPIVLVGLMGCGKSSIGKRLAARLGLPFVDADDEIERAAAKTINEIFQDHGEAHFRDGERRVIARLLSNGAQVLATGGGAFINEHTRRRIQEMGISIWLRADLPVLMRRVSKRDTRPLLRDGHPEATMKRLMESRYPVYAEADMTIESRDEAHDIIVTEIIERLATVTLSKPHSTTPTPAARKVRVDLAARSYDVIIAPGLVETAGETIKARFPKAKCGIVTDENVARFHLKSLEASLQAAGIHAGTVILPAGEATKSFAQLGPLSEKLLAMGLERGDLVVPFGGGVIGDLAGFAAGIIRRGMRFVQFPTTLLAQVDSSVGGKTGINTPQGKNLVGVFHQPSLVLADTNVLSTLPGREMRAGYAEVVKYGLLGDAPFFAWLETHWPAVFGNGEIEMTDAIETSVKAKAAIVARDETETGDRALLNLGHTFGHALEAWTGYSSRLLHGEAVAIGMCQAFRFSEELGLCIRGTAKRVVTHINAVGLPTSLAEIPGEVADADQLVALMGQDKKVKDGQLTFILVRGIGEAVVSRDISRDRVKAFLQREISGTANPT